MAILLTLAAIGVHIYLTQHFFDLKAGASEGGALCNINEVFNCDAVTASKYSAFLGIPIALWGAATNAILLYFLLVSRFNMVQDRARSSRYALVIATGTVVASVVMGVISLSSVGNICIFCVSAYVLSLLGFGATWMGAEDLTLANVKEDLISVFTSERWVLGFLVAIPVLAFVSNLMIKESYGLGQAEKVANEKVAYWQLSPQQNFDLSAGLVMQAPGGKEPVMTIVEFADFRCPHCKMAAPTLHAFTKAHPDVKLVFKPFPLDGTCNDAMKQGGDGISCGLAFSVMCAEKMAQKGWAAHDYIFDNQRDITMLMNLDKNLDDISTHIGVKADDMKACVKSPEIQAAVRAMAKEGEVAQIQGTPAVFVNGKVLNQGQLIPILEAAYKTLK
ncbi:Vitamin K epoxide reductase family protein [compost metagenome]